MGGALATIKMLPKMIVKTGGKLSFMLKKNKPQIFVIAGVTVAAGSFVWGMWNARKIDGVMAEKEAKLDDVALRRQEAENPENGLSDEEKKNIISVCNKETSQIKRESAFAMFKLVGLPVIAFVGGLALTIDGHFVLVKRFGQLSTAYASLQEMFNRYRQMNIREHGEECDRRYRYGIVDSKKVEATITDENGKEKKVTAKLPVVDESQAASLYSFVFDEASSRKCYRDPIMNISFLRNQEKYWNIWMEAKQKPVTLYMVLEELGIELDPDDPRNDYIMIAGWRPNGDGDNHIDFGIMRAINKQAISGEENSIWLNFNCDGNLYHSTRYGKDGRKIC
jgi:hypothetical protein